MTIRITCPGCQSALALSDAMRGKKVRCKACAKVLSIPAAGKAKSLAEANDVEEAAIQDQPRLKASKASAPVEDDEDRPAKKKKKKSKQGPSMLLIGGAAAAVVVLLVVGGVSAFILLRDKPDRKDKEDKQAIIAARDVEAKKKPKNQNQPPPQGDNGPVRVIPKIEDGNPAKKGGFIGGIRAAGYVTERKNELGQIGKAFNQFAIEYKLNARTQDAFLEYIKTFGPIRDSVRDGFYVVNMKAEPLSSSSIIAYEHDKYEGQGYLCVRGDCSVDHVSEADWKAALGK